MKVLFVEDDPMNRRVVSDMLQVASIDMTEAVDAESGLLLLDDHAFDLVLMDLRMPGMDGLTAIRKIRARGDAVAQVAIIVVTADAAPDLREQCEKSGADDLILKPVAMDTLFDSIAKVMAGRNIDFTMF